MESRWFLNGEDVGWSYFKNKHKDMNKEFESYRVISNKNHGTRENGISLQEVNVGSLQRIADASEKMAAGFNILMNDYKNLENRLKNAEREIENYKGWYLQKGKMLIKLERSNAALKGVITKLKKKKDILCSFN